MRQCDKCEEPVEAERYTMCWDCWWKQDLRNILMGGTVDLEKNMKDKEYEEKDKTYAQPGPAPSPFALNSRFIVESYKEDRGLKATVQNGFAMVSQKVSLKGLKLLIDVEIHTNSRTSRQARKGDLVYVREEYLQSQPWAKKTFTSEAVEGEFIIVDAQYVEFVVPK